MFSHVIITFLCVDVEIESNYALAKYTAWIQRLRSVWLANRKEVGGKAGATQHSSNSQKQKQSLANKQE